MNMYIIVKIFVQRKLFRNTNSHYNQYFEHSNASLTKKTPKRLQYLFLRILIASDKKKWLTLKLEDTY